MKDSVSLKAEKEFRLCSGKKPTTLDLVADALQREFHKMSRHEAEAAAFVAIRRLRKEDIKRGFVRVKKRD